MSANEIPEIKPLDLSTLKKRLQPPPELEQRVLIALANRGFVRLRTGGKFPWEWLAIAASISLFCIGIWEGNRDLQSLYSQPTYVFFLYEGPEFQRPATQDEEKHRIAEYKNWAMALRRRNVAISATKLGDDTHVVSANLLNDVGKRGYKIAGLFEVHVGSLEQALSIALTCPHVRHGGKVEVRPIDSV